MAPLTPRKLGSTGLDVTPVCLGTSPLASMPSLYGYDIDDARAESTIEAAFARPLNFIDTSNNYGDGTAETRIGRVIARHGGLPAGVVLATKVDADQATRDFSGDRVRRSAEESLARLGLDTVQLMYLHDAEFYMSAAEAMAPGGPVEALLALRSRASSRTSASPVGTCPSCASLWPPECSRWC